MNTYRNKLTGAIIEIPSEFGSSAVWEKLTPAPAAKKTVKAEPEKKEEPKKATAPKKTTTTKRAVKK